MRNFSEKKLFSLKYTNIDKVKIFHVLHDKVALLTRRRSEREQEIVTKGFLESFGP